jgi:colicin import membrane protein
MNTTTKTEQSALAVPPATEAGALALITLSPEKYAAEVYQPFKDQLAAAIDSVRAIDYDITTTVGMAIAVKCRATFRDLRTDTDKLRKERKAPMLKIGKLLESGCDDLIERVSPLEEMFDADIKAEEVRKAEAKAAKEKAEQERVDAIYALIDAIRIQPAQAVGSTSEQLTALLAEAGAREITTEEFSTLAPQAQVALDAVTVELQTMLAAAIERERIAAEAEAARIAEAERLAAERAENARVAAENARIAAEHKAEAERLAAVAKAQQDAAEARQKEINDAAWAAQAEAKRIADEQQAAFDKQAAEIKAQRDALEAQQAAADKRDAAAAKKLADDQQREADHGPALAMNAEFDAERAQASADEAERQRLQAIIEQAQEDEHQPMPDLDALMDDAAPAPTDAELIEQIADIYFWGDRSKAIARLQAIDFAAVRAA